MSAHRWAIAASVLCLVLASACGRQPASVTHAATVPIASVSPDSPNNGHLEVRATGKIRAVHFFTVQTPQLSGQGGRLTLTALIPNGVKVKKGDPIAEFDSTQEDDKAREARAKFEDLGHQVEQRAAQNRADAEKRTSDLRKAEADLAKARIQLS